MTMAMATQPFVQPVTLQQGGIALVPLGLGHADGARLLALRSLQQCRLEPPDGFGDQRSRVSAGIGPQIDAHHRHACRRRHGAQVTL